MMYDCDFQRERTIPFQNSSVLLNRAYRMDFCQLATTSCVVNPSNKIAMSKAILLFDVDGTLTKPRNVHYFLN
jgi:hypothetical protein